MKPLNQSVRDAFLEAARGRGVAAGEVWDYVKWLRYYLDFCEKYRHEAIDRESWQAFFLKLASKNQSAEQQAQAARSVRLYLELAAAPTAISAAPAPPAPGAASSPHSPEPPVDRRRAHAENLATHLVREVLALAHALKVHIYDRF